MMELVYCSQTGIDTQEVLGRFFESELDVTFKFITCNNVLVAGTIKMCQYKMYVEFVDINNDIIAMSELFETYSEISDYLDSLRNKLF